MYLIDTNVFLEILLAQEKSVVCKRFLDANISNSFITDFSLHSIGVILFRNAKESVFQKFVDDVISNIEVVRLQKELYGELTRIRKILGLDFDDAYQYKVAIEHGLEIATMDKDFDKVKKKVKVRFL